MNKGILSIAIISLLAACNKSDEATLKPTLTLIVNGSSKEVSIPEGVLDISLTQNGHEHRTLMVSAMVERHAFSFGVFNVDFQNPPVDGIKIKSYTSVFAANSTAECLSLDGVQLCDGGLVNYREGGNQYLSDLNDAPYNSFIKITACDPLRKTVSGEFDVMVNQQGIGAAIVLKGEFKSVVYQVVR
jgi:hypothetical protein